MKKLITCGCSFTYGDGLVEPQKTSYGALLGSYLDLQHINLALRGSSNHGVALQIEHALNHYSDIDTIVVSSTSYQRFPVYIDEYQNEPHNKITYQDLVTGKIQFENAKAVLNTGNSINSHRLKSIERYVVDVYHQNIQQSLEDKALSFECRNILDRGIKLILITPSFNLLKFFDKNSLKYSFFDQMNIHPDTLGTMHISETGHNILFHLIKEKFYDRAT